MEKKTNVNLKKWESLIFLNSANRTGKPNNRVVLYKNFISIFADPIRNPNIPMKNNILSNFVTKVILFTKRFSITKARINNIENRTIAKETSMPIIIHKLAEINPLNG